MTGAERIVSQASKWVGYLEKKSNSQLDDFTANAGSNNYTRFNRDLISYKQGIGAQPMEWCAAFVSCCFVYEFGLEVAKQLLCGGLHCYTPSGANYFKKKGRYIKRGSGKPKVGDVIFFYSSSKGRIGHVGIVYKVSGSTVYTIEGNTSGANTLITNGGGVKKKSYSMSSTYIDGYGSVDYSIVDGGTPVTPTETPDLKKGAEGIYVEKMQKLLLDWNKDCLPKYGADGDFGTETENAVKAFQSEKKLTVNGVCNAETWAALGADSSKLVLITGSSVYIRTGAGTGNKSIGIVHKGETYPYVNTASNGWFEVKYLNGTAFVSNKYAKIQG